MPRPKEDDEQGIPVPYDRDALTRRALVRLTGENQRLKALVVSLSELVIKNVVGTQSDKDKLD
jgi:hypothetical protein